MALSLLTALIAPPSARAEELAVVLSSDVESDDLSLFELRDVFAFQKRYWPSGAPIAILYTSEELESGSLFLEVVYQRTPVGLRRMILESLNRGEIDYAPRVVATDALALKFVSAGDNMIAVVRSPANIPPGTKVVRIDGKIPGEPGYPLRR